MALNTLDEANLDEAHGVSYNSGTQTHELFTFQNVHIQGVGLPVPGTGGSPAAVFGDVTTWMNWDQSADALGNPTVGNAAQWDLEDQVSTRPNCICDAAGVCNDQWNTSDPCNVQVLVGDDTVNYLENLSLTDWSSGTFATLQRQQAGVDSGHAGWALPWLHVEGRPLPIGMSSTSVGCK